LGAEARSRKQREKLIYHKTGNNQDATTPTKILTQKRVLHSDRSVNKKGRLPIGKTQKEKLNRHEQPLPGITTKKKRKGKESPDHKEQQH